MNPETETRDILQYKIIAIKGEQSFEATGPSLDEAMKTIGVQLGVVPRN